MVLKGDVISQQAFLLWGTDPVISESKCHLQASVHELHHCRSEVLYTETSSYFYVSFGFCGEAPFRTVEPVLLRDVSSIFAFFRARVC